MAIILNELLSTILQIGIFTLIPFLFFVFRKDKSQFFFQWICFIKPPLKSIVYVFFISLLFVAIGIGLIFIDDGIRQVVTTPPSINGNLREMGLHINTIIILLIIALFKTSLAEEILFRGFIAKQLIQKFNFKIGNLLQALIFGCIHLLLFWALTKANYFPLIFIFILSTLAGWSIGYVKEKYANGSIIPGWIAHAIGNTISYFIIAFVL
ncbi:MAG TPA: CPBP family intramembrane metalloprotease [Chitinophagaceae bacterium]|nr:CPBP family intramembrane metalloprotease [Chitinophagaceae bacterium]